MRPVVAILIIILTSATLPLNAKVVSLDCGDVCIADFNEKIMEFDW